MLQAWNRDATVEGACNALKAKHVEEMRVRSSLTAKEERVRGLMARFALESQQSQGFIFGLWTDFTRVSRDHQAKKQERTKAVMKQFTSENELLQTTVLKSWSGFLKERRTRMERVTNNFISAGNMLLQLVLQTWANDLRADAMSKAMNAKQEEEQRAARARQKEERVKALLRRLAMEGQQVGMVVFKAWVDFLNDLRAKRSKKKE